MPRAIGIEYNQAVIQEAAFGIPKGAPHAYWAQRLLAEITKAENQGIYANELAYPGLNLKSIDFVDPKVGMVQARWEHLNREQSLLTKTQAILLDGHFVIEHAARNRSGRFMSFNGTAGAWRRTCIADAGGWHHDTLTEDLDLSYRAQLKGWRFKYLPEVDCPSELPVETFGFQTQQSRWAKGLTQVAIKLLGRILKAPLPWRVKLEAFLHLTPNITFPLMIIVSALMLPVMICRFYVGWQQLAMVDLPILLASFASILFFYVYAQHQLDRSSWKRTLLLMPVVMAAGAALTEGLTGQVVELAVLWDQRDAHDLLLGRGGGIAETAAGVYTLPPRGNPCSAASPPTHAPTSSRPARFSTRW